MNDIAEQRYAHRKQNRVQMFGWHEGPSRKSWLDALEGSLYPPAQSLRSMESKINPGRELVLVLHVAAPKLSSLHH